MKKKIILLVSSLIIIVGVSGITFWLIKTHISQSSIPEPLLKKSAFTIFSQDPSGKIWKLDKKYASFDSQQGILMLKFTSGSNSLSLNQQATPDPFNDVPNYYSILLNKLHEYSEIHTSIGTIALTHPEELKGGQSAVINVKGTLIFAHPQQDMSDEEWTQFFNSLEIVR